MCGIVGFMTPPTKSSVGEAVLHRMGQALHHRGPDAGGFWADPEAGIALAHRRLAIIDLSDAGSQPMQSRDGRFVLSYNGEIYNHRELRRQLEADHGARQWRGGSDTETLLAAIELSGVDGALDAAAGMFAFALWDRQERCLWLARDRMGEKPLYYGLQSGVLLFASELKALRGHPAFKGDIEPAAADAMLRLGHVPAPLSIYRDIAKLPAGTVLKIDASDPWWANGLPQPRQYWSPVASFATERARGLKPDNEGTTNELEALLSATISDQMIADVPLGAFLSGGIDSTLVTALMQAQRTTPVRTFTIGFDDADMNEAHAAGAVARHLRTDHTELYVTPQASLDVIADLPAIYDEPFADASQIPTYIMCKMARQHVTVALSGDGGDELFGGYNRHVAARTAGRLTAVPFAIRQAVTATLSALPRNGIALLADKFGAGAAGIDPRQISRKIEKVSAVLSARDRRHLYRTFIEHTSPFDPLTQLASSATMQGMQADIGDIGDLAQEFMLRDMLGYLPDDVLVKLDRAAMAASLETRAPFLDHRVVAFSHRLPSAMKIRDGKGKRILRDILARHVPSELFERPKMGFSVPIDTWLRGPLRDWAEALLSPDCLREMAILNGPAIRRMWESHLKGTGNWSIQLWSVLMLQSWWIAQRDTTAAVKNTVYDSVPL